MSARDDDPDTNSPEDLGYRPPPATMPRPTTRGKNHSKAEEVAAAKDEGVRSFTVVLGQIGDGDFAEECSVQFHDLVATLRAFSDRWQRDGKGKMTIDLSVSALGNGTITVSGDIKLRKPTPKRAGSVFFLTPGNNLTLENPRQQKLPLREVPIAPRAVRELDETRPVRST